MRSSLATFKSKDGKAIVRQDWDGTTKHWLVSAYEKWASADKTSDTASVAKPGDTALRSASPVENISQSSEEIKPASWVSLWSRDPVSAGASGALGFAGQSPNAGETTPTVSPQGDGANIAPETNESQPAQEAKEPRQGTALLSLASKINFSPISTEVAAGVVARMRPMTQKVWNVDPIIPSTFVALTDEVKAAQKDADGNDDYASDVIHEP